MSVHITQYLCENRHCIMAATWEEGGGNRQGVEAAILAKLSEVKANPWCGLCGSTKLHFEDGVSVFGSLKDAMPEMKACEAEQQITARQFSKLFKSN